MLKIILEFYIYPKYLNISRRIREQRYYSDPYFISPFHFSLNSTIEPLLKMIFNPFRLVMGSNVY